MKTHTCECCKWAGKWDRTPTGRIKRGAVVSCRYEFSWPVLPFSITRQWNFRLLEPGCVSATDGETCPCWQLTDAAKEKQ